MGTRGRCKTEELQLAQTATGGASGRIVRGRIVRVHAPARTRPVDEMPIDRPNGPLGCCRQRHDVPRTDGTRGSRIEGHVVRVPGRRLDDGIKPPLQFVGQALVGHGTHHVSPVSARSVRGEWLPVPKDAVASDIAAHGAVHRNRCIKRRSSAALDSAASWRA
jgi:hypothetical protein